MIKCQRFIVQNINIYAEQIHDQMSTLNNIWQKWKMLCLIFSRFLLDYFSFFAGCYHVLLVVVLACVNVMILG